MISTTSTTIQDPAERALMDEFGAYLEQLTRGFSQPVEASIKHAEQELLARFTAHGAAISANHEKELESLKTRNKELQQLASQFTLFLQSQQQRLAATEENFRTDIKQEIQTQMTQQVSRLHAEVRSLKSRTTLILVFSGCLFALVPLLLWFLRR
jgi:hypothetical protein